ncbi:hypothetical protein [Lysobacter hankyongensis]|uniref:Uncharacterized protein n=1 Tax=Lysobacter hankyongensis TaxID=1176535 RepID=A0ABP9BLI9_9GAMM
MPIRRLALALMLALAWVPTAYAFPPCPREPLELVPLDGSNPTASTGAPHWYKGFHALVGNPVVIGGLARWTADDDSQASPFPDSPTNGKCHDRLPIPGDNAASGSVSLTPSYPDGAGFGVVALPDLRYNTEQDLGVRYTLAFTVDDQAMIEAGEWLDIAQLEFRWNAIDDIKDPDAVSAMYRIRKAQPEKDRLVLEVIETRVPYIASGQRPPVFEHVVATIPVQQGGNATRVGLRWAQVVGDPVEPVGDIDPKGFGEISLPVGPDPETTSSGGAIIIGPPIVTRHEVSSVLEVIGPGNRVVYRIALPQQWANSLSMGLLDYNIGKESDYGNRFGAEMIDTALCAETTGTTDCTGVF